MEDCARVAPPDDDETAMKPADAKRLCTQFNHFFIKKLQRTGIRHEIETRLSTQDHLPRLCVARRVQ